MTASIGKINPQQITEARAYLAKLDQVNLNKNLPEAWRKRISKINLSWMMSCQYNIAAYKRWVPVSTYYKAVASGVAPQTRSTAMTGTIQHENLQALSDARPDPTSKTKPSLEVPIETATSHEIAPPRDPLVTRNEFLLKMFDEIRTFGVT
jgi:hypothetical protein